ncbi:MAG: hypothetical protein NVSMB39_6390 [Candidatus Saccharimonadales bacterium]
MAQAPAVPSIIAVSASRRELVIEFDGNYRFILRPKLSLTRKMQGLGSLELYRRHELLVRYVGPSGSEPAGRLQLMHYDWTQARFAGFWQAALISVPPDGSIESTLIRLGDTDYMKLLHGAAQWEHLTT